MLIPTIFIFPFSIFFVKMEKSFEKTGAKQARMMRTTANTRLKIEKGQLLCELGEDFPDAIKKIKKIATLSKTINFDVNIIKTLPEDQLIDFRNAFHKLIRGLRDNHVAINLNSVRKQSFLLNRRFIGPETMEFWFHNKCNLRCNFCSIYTPLMSNLKHVPQALDFKKIANTLDQGYEMGVQGIRLISDGEPMISPDIIKILEIILANGFYLHLFTNGTVFNERHFSLFERFKSLSFLINFSAAQEETYRNIYGGNPKNFQIIQKALLKLAQLKIKNRQLGCFFEIKVNYIITNQNYQEVDQFIILSKKLGVDFIVFKFAVLHEEGESLLLNTEQLREFKAIALKAKHYAEKILLDTNLDALLAITEDKGFQKKNDIKQHSVNLPTLNCYNGWFFANMNSRGEYFICGYETVHHGNLNEKTFKEIYFSQPINDILKEGAHGIDLAKPMWSRCNFCNHLSTNQTVTKWLEQKAKNKSGVQD